MCRDSLSHEIIFNHCNNEIPCSFKQAEFATHLKRLSAIMNGVHDQYITISYNLAIEPGYVEGNAGHF